MSLIEAPTIETTIEPPPEIATTIEPPPAIATSLVNGQGPSGPPGPTGPPGQDGTDAHYVHDQAAPATEWTITHGLGKFPAVTILDTAGTEWDLAVEHLSDMACIARASVAIAGQAICN